MKFGELPALQRALVVMNALATLPATFGGLIFASYYQQAPTRVLLRAVLHASPVVLFPLVFAFLAWAALRLRAKWFQSLVAVLMLPMLPVGTVYGVIALKVYWGRRE